MNNPFNRLSMKEKTVFIKRLSFLVRAGVPLLESLTLLKKQTKPGAKSKVIDQVIHDIANGQPLYKSIAKFKQNFDQFAVNIIKIGEESGTLDRNLDYLAEEMKKKNLLQRKVIGALIYPVFIVIATLGIAGMLTIYIFPKILPIFASLNVTLPLTTRILIGTSNFLKEFGLFVLLGLAAVIILVPVTLRIGNVRYWFHRALLMVPLIGPLIQNYNLTNICRTMGLLLKSEVRLVKTLEITSETTSNLVYKRALEKIAQQATKGKKITAYMVQSPAFFPDILTHMIDIGEKTGSLDETFVYLSEMYDSEVDEMTKNLSTAIEPILMIFMGLMVGFIAVSIITPIYQITQHLTPK